MSNISKEDVVQYLEGLTVLEMADFVKELEDKWGVSAAAPVAVAAGVAGGTDAGAVEEEKTEFDVVLTSFGEKKIQVIKAVREITGLGLKEAKELVEGVPNTLKEAVAKEEAEQIKTKIEEVGGSAEVK